MLLPRLPYATGQTLLACHFGLLVAFQTLGTLRAGQSWLQAQRAEIDKKTGDTKEPTEADVDSQSSSDHSYSDPSSLTTGRKNPRRASSEVWPALSIGNLEIGLSLLLEFVQMASFPFQGSATDGESNGDIGTNDDESTLAPEWMQSMHGIAYVTDLSPLNRFFSSVTIPTVRYFLLLRTQTKASEPLMSIAITSHTYSLLCLHC